MSTVETKIGEILIKRKYITRKQLDHALENQENNPLGETLIQMGYVSENEISQALTQQSTIQTVREELSDAVRNPVQHKLLWFIVVFALIGIGIILIGIAIPILFPCHCLIKNFSYNLK